MVDVVVTLSSNVSSTANIFRRSQKEGLFYFSIFMKYTLFTVLVLFTMLYCIFNSRDTVPCVMMMIDGAHMTTTRD